MMTLESRPKFQMFARVLLAYAGCSLGLMLLVVGLLPAVGIFGEPTDLSRISALPTWGGVVLVVWTLLGVIRPTPIRFLPPALVSIPVAVAGWIVHVVSTIAA